jgi:pilus assembly protein Flp/PilA
MMTKIATATRRFIREEDGAALAEYGILIAFIAIAAIVAVTFFGGKIKQKFSDLGNSFS